MIGNVGLKQNEILRFLKKVSKSANNGRLKWARSKQLEQAFILVYTTTLPPYNSAHNRYNSIDGFSSGYCYCCWLASEGGKVNVKCRQPVAMGISTLKGICNIKATEMAVTCYHGLFPLVQWQ